MAEIKGSEVFQILQLTLQFTDTYKIVQVSDFGTYIK